MTLADISTYRLERILSKDKTQNPKQILPLMKSDITSLLLNYLTLKKITADFDVENGEYVFKFEVRASQIKNLGILS